MDNERAIEYANGDNDFAAWLDQVDGIVEGTSGVSLFDLPDCLLRDMFDSGETPSEAAEAALENDYMW